MLAWDLVIKQGIFKETRWTVKVNAETYFCPDRLRHRLGNIQGSSEEEALYMKTALHPKDPLEVYSRKAVEVYAASSSKPCGHQISVANDQKDEQVCSSVGAFLRRLGVAAQLDHGLLIRRSCAHEPCPPLDPMDCSICKYSAFDPLKSPANYSLCHSYAQSEG